VNRDCPLVEELQDASEDTVDCLVTAAKVPPAFNHSGVVTPDSDVCDVWVELDRIIDKKLKPDGFGPLNVAFALRAPPVREEAPRAPAISENNRKAMSATCVRVGCDVKDFSTRPERTRDALVELLLPPLKLSLE
jgi:hypothetical protein